MREIKFRAWFELENKMVLPENLALSYDGNDGFDFAFDKEFPDEEGNIPGTLCFKLMQYTGLKDKNGKEIYEGDIIKRTINDSKVNSFTGKVIHDEGAWFIVRGEDCLFLCPNFKEHKNEVIGNIYENPELIK